MKIQAPDARGYRASPARFRLLVEETGLTQAEVAERLGISLRTLAYHATPGTDRPAPYTVAYTLEMLAKHK